MPTATKAKPRKKAPAKTLVVNFVLDKSGSMNAIRDATISGFNEYLGTLQKRKERLLFTLTLFDSDSIDTLYTAAAIGQVAELNHDTYIPGALTPMYDAVGRTIKETEKAIASKRSKPNVLCVIMTDGLENASKEYTQATIRSLIEEKERDGWTFAYLGANQDAWAASGAIGVPHGNTILYRGTPVGAGSAMAAAAGATVTYTASGGVPTRDFFQGRKRA